MTLKDLHRFIQIHTSESNEMKELIEKCKDVRFYTWMPKHINSKTLHKSTTHKGQGHYCCFDHIIGLPVKNGIQLPLFQYENEMYKALTEPPYLNSDMNYSELNLLNESFIERNKHKRVQRTI